MSKSDPVRIHDYLSHIIEAIARIDEYTGDMFELEFLENKLVQDAVIRNIEIIGEASRNVYRYHPDFAERYSEIPWTDMYLMRNRISHGYFSVDLEIVWRTVENDLPELGQAITKIYGEIKA